MHAPALARTPNTLRPAPVLGAVVLTALLAGCGTPTSPTTGLNYQIPAQPEGSSGYTEKPGWATEQFAVAAANPLATDAGYQVLKAGGSAIDAAIAVQMVLGLVEPQSSGIGGGAFLLHAAGSQVLAYDGRETAPAAATENLFLKADGQPMAFHDAVVGGRSVGTPGAVRMLELAHREHGKLPWASLLQPAIQLAEQGFKVSPRLHTLLSSEKSLPSDPVARAYFYGADGQPLPVGTLLKNPAYAQVLRAIAQHGSQALHEGPLAQAIVDKVRNHPTNPGVLSLQDLAGYQPKKRQALCHDWNLPASAPGGTARSYTVCGFPPPSSGAIAVGQILGILGHTPAARMPLGSDGLPSADWLHYYTEAARLAFADRALYVADPDFVQPPGGSWHTLLDHRYLQERAGLIGAQSMKVAKPGNPAQFKVGHAPMPEQIEYGTSHISIVDAFGNALAMTTTIEDQFGSRQMVQGFLLNNELTDFSMAPRAADGQPIANRVQPGKRPRSSMAPTLVFDKATGQVIMSAGSPGGAQIIHYTAKTLQGVLGWGLTPQQAINLPNFSSLNGPTLLEAKRFPAATVQALQARGAEVKEQDLTSGLQAITRGEAHGKRFWFGGADPRREGVVMGD
ncbi:gamma-glutamyltransferase family protein [Comamonas aquatica]|uniref:Gamma-glutamyltransferase family protein n=1 Tax=Comamonas aquatica TaxID=225991 RepID=A0AA43AVU2_9BURK|nr:gamma-glutamyltransferase family protein [Comamonas aquatica]MDH1429281.1 gamma-glutamyltransferase family protein [Comamonas aquatica]MDH1604825.1 gamma-glutamyltransferase family protein [Comamonas aquatica]MDH1617056.1 gamma-glutamyltransferase family protein [Comamonas aquatica]MDH2004677.1 gamma-glutamyltransferase family protein [Comamonas aquatica]